MLYFSCSNCSIEACVHNFYSIHLLVNVAFLLLQSSFLEKQMAKLKRGPRGEHLILLHLRICRIILSAAAKDNSHDAGIMIVRTE